MAILYDSTTSTNGQLTQSGQAAGSILAGGSELLTLPRAVPSGSTLCVVVGGAQANHTSAPTLTDNASGNTYTLAPIVGWFNGTSDQFGLVSFYGLNIRNGPTVLTYNRQKGLW